MSDTVLEFNFKNGRVISITLILEPWAEEFVVQPSSTVSLKIKYTKLRPLEVLYDEKYLTVWLWGGCCANVFLDGENVTPKSLSIIVPG